MHGLLKGLILTCVFAISFGQGCERHSHGDTSSTLPDPPETDFSVNPPRNLRASTLSSTEIALTWRDTSNGQNSFMVERSDGNALRFYPAATVSAGTTAYTDGNRTPSTTYFYRVLACTDDDTCSPPSNIYATTPGTMPYADLSLMTDRSFGVNDEIFFTAWGSIPDEDVYNNPNDPGEFARKYVYSTYLWEFGDGTSVNEEEGGGISVTHAYCRPGTYTVRLTVIAHDGARYSASVPITVDGEYLRTGPRPGVLPLLYLDFDETLTDESSAGLVANWGAGESAFREGVQGKALELTGGNYLTVDDPGELLNSLEEFTLSFWIKKIHESNAQYTYIMKRGEQLMLRFLDQYAIQARISTGPSAQYTVEDWYTIDDTDWHQIALVYSGNQEHTLKIFVDGEVQEDNRAVTPASGPLAESTAPLFIGADENRGNSPDILIDELRLYGRALSRSELFSAFELHHADFHARTAQFVYVTIPGEFTSTATNRLQAVIAGGDLSSEMIVYEKEGLDSNEKFLVRHHVLPGSEKDYVLSVRILTESGSILEESKVFFYKPYDGVPLAGLDENNAFRIRHADYPEGKLLFPVASCGLNNENLANNLWGFRHADAGNIDDLFKAQMTDYINADYTQGFWPVNITVEGWKDYLDLCINLEKGVDLKAMGPTAWEGLAYIYLESTDPNGAEQITHKSRRYQNSSIENMMKYVDTLKDHAAMLVWNWADEYNFHEPAVAAEVIRSFTYLSHRQDPEHPVMASFMGFYWCADGLSSLRRSYGYSHNARHFGKFLQTDKGVNVADVLAQDFYPIDRARMFAENATIMNTIRQESGNLLPLMSFVETPDIAVAPYLTPWSPTPAMLRMNIWQNVVHGSQAIGWFHYFGRTPAENFDAMARFLSEVTTLSPALAGSEPENKIEIDYGGQEATVDTLLREAEGNLVLFAVRRSEITVIPEEVTPRPTVPPDPVQNYDVTVTFDLGDVGLNGMATVYGEDRSIPVNAGAFTDIFRPYEVHIYTLE